MVELGKRLDRGHLLWNNLETKILFHDNNDIYIVETVDTHIFLQTCIGKDVFLFNFKIFNKKIPYFLFNFCSCHN